MFPSSLGHAAERQADVTMALAFGKNAHCQLGQYPPGQGISCTEVRRVCGVMEESLGGRGMDSAGKCSPV